MQEATNGQIRDRDGKTHSIVVATCVECPGGPVPEDRQLFTRRRFDGTEHVEWYPEHTDNAYFHPDNEVYLGPMPEVTEGCILGI